MCCFCGATEKLERNQAIALTIGVVVSEMAMFHQQPAPPHFILTIGSLEAK
jgi:hypothetical protein